MTAGRVRLKNKPDGRDQSSPSIPRRTEVTAGGVAKIGQLAVFHAERRTAICLRQSSEQYLGAGPFMVFRLNGLPQQEQYISFMYPPSETIYGGNRVTGRLFVIRPFVRRRFR